MIYAIALLILSIILMYYAATNGGLIINFPLVITFLELLRVVLVPIGLFDGFYGVILIIYVFFIILSFKNHKFEREIITLYILFIIISVFYLIQTDFGDGVFNGLSRVIRVLFIFACFFIGYKKINSSSKLKKITTNFSKAILIFVIATLVFTIFQYGKQRGFIFGFIQGEIYLMSLYVIVSILSIIVFKSRDKKDNKYIYVLPLICLFLITISLSRTSLVIVIIGLLIYAFAFFRLSKIRKIFYVGVLAAVVMIGFVITTDLYTQRSYLFDDEYEVQNENRFIETIIIYYEHLDSTEKKLFGSGKLFTSSIAIIGNPERVIHSTYNRLLHGVGFIGVGLFLIFNFIIIYKIIKVKSLIHYSFIYKLAALGIIFGFLFTAIAGVTYPIAYSTLAFFFVGSILRNLDNTV